MFINLLRFILLFWIVSVLLRLFRLWGTSKDTTGNSGNTGEKANAPFDLDQTSRIDDAEFEEIDKK